MVNYLALAIALVLSTVAAYYSVVGLATIFAAAFWPIIIMGGSLEAAKVVATSWVYRHWHVAPRMLRYYLVGAICVLMLITSMGTFGYLSKAHLDQSITSGDAMAKLAIYDEKIKTAKDNIDANRKALKQLDEAVDQVMGRSSTEAGADKAVALRRGQSKERARLTAEIAAEQQTISKLNEEAAPIRIEVRKVEAEVGPLKYIAELLYGQSTDEILGRAVRWVIILIVIVFDPLAVALLLAANYGLSNRPTTVPAPVEKVTQKGSPPAPKSVDVAKKKEKKPLWMRKASQLIQKKKRGTIEIDESSVMRMK